MNDLISRRAVLAALTDISYNHCKTEGEAIVIDTAKTLVTVMPSAQPEVAKDTNVPNNDTISRQSAIDAVNNIMPTKEGFLEPSEVLCELMQLPSAHQTLYGYDIEHLKLIANILQKENLTPERVADALMDIGRIVVIVGDEYRETLRKAVEQCRI